MSMDVAEIAGLLPCPICGAQPKRNGRGRVGGVLCAGPGSGVGKLHRVQTYGADQAEADAAWNARAARPAPAEDAVERVGRALAENGGRSYAIGREVFDSAARAALAAMQPRGEQQAGREEGR